MNTPKSKRPRLDIPVPPGMQKQVEKLAKANDRSVASFIRQLISEAWAKAFPAKPESNHGMEN